MLIGFLLEEYIIEYSGDVGEQVIMCKYILEATIENLQLLLGEVSLGFQLLKTLWPVTHRCHLKLIIGIICSKVKENTNTKITCKALKCAVGRKLQKFDEAAKTVLMVVEENKWEVKQQR